MSTSNRTLELEQGWLDQVLAIVHQRVADRPVYAFGSRTKGRFRRRSDLDLAIGGLGEVGFDRISLLKEDFSESDLPIFVDVLDLNSIDPGFRKRIEPELVPVYIPEGQVAA